MTTVYIHRGKKTLTVSVRGHCTHEVCVSISAITQTLLQYTQDFLDDNGNFRVEAMEHGYGHTLLSVFCEERATMARYMAGAEAIITGFELYEHSFPDDIVLTTS